MAMSRKPDYSYYFLIKGIGAGIIWSCPLNSWLHMGRLGVLVCMRSNIWDTLGLQSAQGPASLYKNAICLQSRLTLLFTTWQSRHTAHNVRQWQRVAGSGKTRPAGWSDAFQWRKVLAGYIPLALQAGWRGLSQIHQECSLSPQINWMSFKEKVKWRRGEGWLGFRIQTSNAQENRLKKWKGQRKIRGLQGQMCVQKQKLWLMRERCASSNK